MIKAAELSDNATGKGLNWNKLPDRKMPLRLSTQIISVLALFITYSVAEPDFNRDIKPILSENCYFCHGPDAGKRKAGLRLDTFKGATTQNDGVTAIIPGKPEESELMARILSTDPDEVMPPPKAKLSLSTKQKELLAQWISSGAEYQRHWSLKSPGKTTVPEGKHPIDELVAKKLQTSNLSPSPEADKVTLLRRVTLDLTGLPPRPEDVAAFLADNSPEAYQKVVDRLLNEPSYGERMAWEWLDAARYADTNGYQGDNERTMWPWRDWVVDAFNANMPFDQFTIWQLAGDLLPEASFEQKLATGFLRNHPINGEGGRIAEENRVDYVMDMTETVGTLWLGLTFNCCRCHDHKFDPLTQREYYKFSAYFNQTPVNGGGRNAQQPPNLAAPGKPQRAELVKITAELAAIDGEMTARKEQLAKNPPGNKPDSPWHPVKPHRMEATKQTLKLQPGLSILVGGDNPRNDTYTIETKTDLEHISAIRLEALMHPSMTGGGLARSDSGNFVLTGFEVSILQPGNDAPLPLNIEASEATFEQGSHKIRNAHDGNPKIGWAVHEGRTVDREHQAVFRMKQPVKAGKGTVVKFILRHDSPHTNHNLGHFRLSLSADRGAPITLGQQTNDALIAELNKKRKDLGNRRKKINDSAPKVMIMQDMPNRRTTYILNKGLYNDRGEEVQMGTPGVLPPMNANFPENRLGMARWLMSESNPLVARVTVNRFWQQLFGVGLVKTSEDFGTQGETPELQELLDYLAVYFRESGWDIKAMMRLIVTSATYRQSAKATRVTGNETNYQLDPENRMLSRGPRFRMPSWMLRDHALSASGLLVNHIGGNPVNTYQPDGVWEEASFGKKRYNRDSGEKLYRRSLYTFWRRIIAPPAFFDNANRQTCSVKPFRTNTPLHALYLLNDITFVEASRVIAENIIKKYPGNDDAKIESVFRQLLSRPPADHEKKILLERLSKSRKAYEADPGAAKAFVSTGEYSRDESLDPAEHASWTALTLAVINLDEALTK